MEMTSIYGGALVVGLDAESKARLERQLAEVGFAPVTLAPSLSRAKQLLPEQAWALIALQTPRCDAERCAELLHQALQAPHPPMLLIGGDGLPPATLVGLAQAGHVVHVESLLATDESLRQLRGLIDPVHVFRRVARTIVGRVPLKDALWYLRGTMGREALGRAEGSRRRAARMLGVDRRHVARIVDEFRSDRFAPKW